MENCNFCLDNNVLKGKILFQNDLCYFVEYMDREDWPHAGMIIPKRHVPKPFELDDAELSAMRDLMNEAKKMFDSQGATGYTIGWNVGADAGQHVDHAHLHLIARFGDDPVRGRGIRWFLKQCRDRAGN